LIRVFFLIRVRNSNAESKMPCAEPLRFAFV
jgi:hypothetical protein